MCHFRSSNSVSVCVPKPSWNQGLRHRLPGRAAPGVVRPVLFLLIDHKPANTTIQHVNQTLNKKERKLIQKKEEKCSNYLLFIVIDQLGDQFTLESVNEISSIGRSDRDVTGFHFLSLTEAKLNWARGRHQMSSLGSDLIVWFWLFHCGWVSLVVQWQWSSVCLMFSSFLYSSTSFAVSWN